MRALTSLALVTIVAGPTAQAQISARLMRYPNVSATQITFTYAGDIWVVAKTGGMAQRLSTPRGEETFARFSPDGKSIAFTANYDGNLDVYVLPVGGGIPQRLTHNPASDRVLGWTPDGQGVLFASGMESGRDRFSRLYIVPRGGGLPKALPVPYGEFGALDPSGKILAYMPISTDFATWKRYRGGMASEIWLYDLEHKTSFHLPGEKGSEDSMPMWHGDTLYFLSDRDVNKRHNIWAYDTKAKTFRQITFFKDYDVHFPSIGPEDIVLEAGGRLHRVELATGRIVDVKVDVVTDGTALKPHDVNASPLIRNATPSPQGKRAILEARGELFSLPAEKGYVLNLTHTPGVAERFPSISPDGSQVAYFCDRTGEYELWVRPADGTGQERQITHLGPGFRYNPFWSPDGKRVAFTDQAMHIQVCDVATGKVTTIDKGLFNLGGLTLSWSSDGRWITYARATANNNGAVMLYDTQEGRLHPITTPYFNAGDATFDPEGNYLFLTTGQEFHPSYSDLDNTWIYANTTRLAAIPLRADVKSPLAPRNDVDEKVKDADKGSKDAKSGKGAKDKEAPAQTKSVGIDLEGLESRMVLLPPPAGNYADLAAVKGKVLYRRIKGGPGEEEDPAGAIHYWDLEEREEKTVLASAGSFTPTSDGSRLLVASKGTFAFVDIKPDQKLDKKLPTGDLPMTVDPKAEWRQIFNDAWRLERDMFYDPGMHQVDWKAERERYGKLLEDCVTRGDVNFVLGELIGELSVSHAYRGGGDMEQPVQRGVGLLGADYALENGAYRIRHILRGAPWDAQARSPLAQPGMNVKEGDYLLAVNHQPVDPAQDPWAAFQGLAGRSVLITVNDKPTLNGARDVVVETLPSEARLRQLDWVEARRAYVDKVSGGKVGYIYVPDTGVGGQTDLVSQFRGQWDKPGLIVDERFNSGGQIPDRFVEMLGRKVLNYWAVRDGLDWQWPPVAHSGSMAMLINGWSGSGGDCFPYYFRQAGLGPLIGRRTWGGLVGISGSPSLIDGGNVTVPTFGIYTTAGAWTIEGHGVDPDIEVMDDPALTAQGKDPQLDKALEVVMEGLRKNPPSRPTHAPYPNHAR